LSAVIMLFGLLFVLLGFVFWVWMLVRAIRYESDTDKIVWVIVIVFTTIVGAVIYWVYRMAYPLEERM
jgi:heme/copper-type cytochrome/quinol oxidase subunit 2